MSSDQMFTRSNKNLVSKLRQTAEFLTEHPTHWWAPMAALLASPFPCRQAYAMGYATAASEGTV